MNQSIVDIETEILEGIKEMINDEENYFFDFDNGKTASYILFRGTETQNFMIDIEIEVHVAIHDTLGLLLTDLDLRDINIYEESGEELYFDFTDKQIKDLFVIF